MTWSLSASGHHLADACEGDDATVTSTFSFSGNHVRASSLADARSKLAAYDAQATGAGEDDGSTTEPES